MLKQTEIELKNFSNVELLQDAIAKGDIHYKTHNINKRINTIMKVKNKTLTIGLLAITLIFASLGLILETKCTKDPNIQEFWNCYINRY